MAEGALLERISFSDDTRERLWACLPPSTPADMADRIVLALEESAAIVRHLRAPSLPSPATEKGEARARRAAVDLLDSRSRKVRAALRVLQRENLVADMMLDGELVAVGEPPLAARHGQAEAATLLLGARDQLGACQSALADALARVRAALREQASPPLEHVAIRLYAQNAIFAASACDICASLSSGVEQQHAELACMFHEDYEQLRARYLEVAGEDLNDELDSRAARAARHRAIGTPRSVAQRIALLTTLREQHDEVLAHVHARRILRAGLKLPASPAAILQHARASRDLGRLAPI